MSSCILSDNHITTVAIAIKYAEFLDRSTFASGYSDRELANELKALNYQANGASEAECTPCTFNKAMWYNPNVFQFIKAIHSYFYQTDLSDDCIPNHIRAMLNKAEQLLLATTPDYEEAEWIID